MFKKLKWLILPLLLSALESHATFCVPDRPPEISSRISSPTSHPTFAHFALFVVSSSSDPSGSLQGAGGVGGLVALVTADDTYVYCMDANGNVVQMLDASDGSVEAQYEYSPFGELTASSGAMADENPFRFSTKYWDIETGLGYWGMRYYHPEQGRWVSRDPLWEAGGLNLFCYVRNGVVSAFDPFGFDDVPSGLRRLMARRHDIDEEIGGGTDARKRATEAALELNKGLVVGGNIIGELCPLNPFIEVVTGESAIRPGEKIGVSGRVLAGLSIIPIGKGVDIAGDVVRGINKGADIAHAVETGVDVARGAACYRRTRGTAKIILKFEEGMDAWSFQRKVKALQYAAEQGQLMKNPSKVVRSGWTTRKYRKHLTRLAETVFSDDPERAAAIIKRIDNKEN